MIKIVERQTPLDYLWECFETSYLSNPYIELDIVIKYIPSNKSIEECIISDSNKNLRDLASSILKDIEQHLHARYVEIYLNDNQGHKIFVNKYFEEDWKEFSNYRFAEVLV